jgi:hypothetical protein
VAICSQRWRRYSNQRACEVEPRRQGAPAAYAAQTLGTGTAQQREKNGLALVLRMMRRDDHAAGSPLRRFEESIVARGAQMLFIAVGSLERQYF